MAGVNRHPSLQKFQRGSSLLLRMLSNLLQTTCSVGPLHPWAARWVSTAEVEAGVTSTAEEVVSIEEVEVAARVGVDLG